MDSLRSHLVEEYLCIILENRSLSYAMMIEEKEMIFTLTQAYSSSCFVILSFHLIE